MTQKKKLIEVALPLEAINNEALRRKQKAPKGWPTSFHKWWAQRPLAAARAVIFAQMVDDPSSYPDLFPTEREQKKERGRLFKLIEELVKWDNTSKRDVVQRAQDEIWSSWRRTCAENADHPNAGVLFDRNKLPAFHDPFAGSGSIPLSAQWMGIESFATDLNPVAVTINKAILEIPPKFAGKSPVNPDRLSGSIADFAWERAQGLGNDVRYYGQWMREEADKIIGGLYPQVEITADLAKDRQDLKPYLGRKLTVTALIWARTVKSPNPAFSNVDVPLVSNFMLSTKAGKETYIETVVEKDRYRFTVKIGKPADSNAVKNGTSAGKRGGFFCLMSGTPINYAHIRAEGAAGRMGSRLMAVVLEGDRGRLYLPPTPEQENAAHQAHPVWKPDTPLHGKVRVNVSNYGFDSYGDLFTDRQLHALTIFSDLISSAIKQIEIDAISAGFSDDGISLADNGFGARAYAESVGVYLACVVDRMVYYGSSFTTWLPKDNALRDCMPRQALAMTWDFAEANPLAKSSGDITTCCNTVASYLDMASTNARGTALQSDAQSGLNNAVGLVISTDPPYYDNIGYADLSDFFYVWLRRSLKTVFPGLFTTMAVPKAEELVATPYRHNSKEEAEQFFLDGMTKAMHRLAEQSHPSYPVTIYYAFKQSETDSDHGVTNTGWDTFLEAVIKAGFSITGTWPMRTEGEGRMIASGTNALASSIVLVCRQRQTDAPVATRRDFLNVLKAELPAALAYLQAGNIAPVDLAQAAIGPGMAVFTRYSNVIDAEGNALPVRQALALINQTLDEALAEQEGDFDADTRWALSWFEQMGFEEDEFGVAEQLSKAKNTAVSGLVEAGIIAAGKGKVRLLKPEELTDDWDPTTDSRLTVWEIVHHLVRVLEAGGESAAADIVAKLGSKSDIARELCYRLYTLCERKKRANEAMAYNALVQSWPEIMRLSREAPRVSVNQTDDLFNQE